MRPFEAEPPLLIDPNAVGIASRALQFLKVMAWKPGEVAQNRRSFQSIKCLLRLPSEAREWTDVLAKSEAPGPAIAVAHDHIG
jgi:hypothetical protein